MKKIVLLCAALAMSFAALAQNIEVKSYKFAEKDGQELMLDIYSASDEVQPCVIYAFGGGFVGGSRAEAYAIKFYKYLVSQGMKVAAIDYRLGLKPIVDQKDQKLTMARFRSMLIHAVEIASEDCLDATAYLIANAEALKIDASKLIACGSSAGAITVLQSEYAIANDKASAGVLPEGFNYAGVISFAGAVLERSGKFGWKSAPCPIMLFHGNADSNVPYDKMSLLGYSFYGSNRVADALDKLDSPYWFYDAENVNHSLAGTPEKLNREEIMIFINRMALGGQRLKIHQSVDDAALPDVKHKFKIKDYVRSNFSDPATDVMEPIHKAHADEK